MSYRLSPPSPDVADQLRVLAIKYAAIAVSVLAMTIVGVWNSTVGFLLFLLGLLVIPASVVTLGLIAAVAIARNTAPRASRHERVASWIGAPVMLLLMSVAMLPLVWLGTLIGDETLLLAYHSRYRSIIARVQTEAPPPPDNSAWQTYGGTTYIADYGSPRRVAFEPSGMLDNWSGIIWDPTHRVMEARGFDPVSGRFYAPAAITKLFGGDLVECRRLGGDWFDCSFT